MLEFWNNAGRKEAGFDEYDQLIGMLKRNTDVNKR